MNGIKTQRLVLTNPKTTRALGLVLAALVALWLLAFGALGYPWSMVGSSADALHFLWVADALSRGVSHPESAYGAHLLWQGRFPPGYPIFLSLFGASTSSGGMLRANLAQVASVVAVVVLLLAYAWRSTRSWLAALGVLVYTLAHPMMTPWSLELFSEALFTALLLAAALLAAAERIPRAWLWVSVLIGMAVLVRSLGLVIVPGLLIWVWHSQHSPIRAAIAGLAALAPAAAWWVLKAAHTVGPGDSYLRQVSATLADSGLGWGERILQQASSFVMALAPHAFPSSLRLLVGATLLAAIVYATTGAMRRSRLEPWIILPVLATLLFWPFPGYLDRLMGPIIPLALVLVLTGDPNVVHRVRTRITRTNLRI